MTCMVGKHLLQNQRSASHGATWELVWLWVKNSFRSGNHTNSVILPQNNQILWVPSPYDLSQIGDPRIPVYFPNTNDKLLGPSSNLKQTHHLWPHGARPIWAQGRRSFHLLLSRSWPKDRAIRHSCLRSKLLTVYIIFIHLPFTHLDLILIPSHVKENLKGCSGAAAPRSSGSSGISSSPGDQRQVAIATKFCGKTQGINKIHGDQPNHQQTNGRRSKEMRIE